MTERLENRRRRASFTKVLQRFCTRLDAVSVFTVTVPPDFPIPAYSGTIRIKSLSAVGSYARGAPTCGDLDLLLELEVLEGKLVPLRKVVREAFGTVPDVRYYQGTQEENTSGIAFGERVLIWEPGADWRQNLAAIKEDSTATRARQGDTVPLRIEQADADLTERRRLTELREQGILRWRLIPYEVGKVPSDLDESQAHMLKVLNSRWGRKSKALLPDIYKYLSTRLKSSQWDEDSSYLYTAGVIFRLGYQSVDEKVLEDPTNAKLVMAPHLSRRGPNAFWEIERGDKHPLEIAFVDRSAYVLCDRQGNPSIGIESSSESWQEAAFVELFSSVPAALKSVEEWLTGSGPEENPLYTEPVLFQGRRLLDLLSYADIVDCISEEGCYVSHYLSECALRVRADYGPDLKIATVEELLANIQVPATEGV